MKQQTQNNIPAILVILGATGDLVSRKITPALFHLFIKGALPAKFLVLGIARRILSNVDFQKYIVEIIKKHAETCKKCSEETDSLVSFAKLFSYSTVDFNQPEGYRSLASSLQSLDENWGVCANKLFYLAVPPEMYGAIFKNLSASGLTKPCSPQEGWTPLELNRLRLENESRGAAPKEQETYSNTLPEALTGWTRVIVEKPFGKDLETAQELENLLSKLFQEIQIYRIDHYLAKEMVQNILAFRFSNNIFEQSWNNNFIEKIEIRLLEKLGVEHRGNFYDSLGALRDVGQNHLLQMLALVTMEHPVDFSAGTIRSKREEILKTLVVPREKEVRDFSFRAQYEDYRVIPGVAKNSATETYFKIRSFLSSPRWQNVPIILESGKRLGEQRKEIVITFKHPTPCLCASGQKHYQNRITIQLEPKEQIIMQFWSKKPGLAFEIEERDFSFLLRDKADHAQYTEEYEKLLLDCIAGDQTLFTSSEEVRAMWRYIDPILASWRKDAVSLETYRPDTNDVVEKARNLDEGFSTPDELKKEIGIVGLGKMGGNLARRLMEKGWRVAGYNRTPEATKSLMDEGLQGVYSLAELVKTLTPSRIIWLMVPAGKPVDEVLFGKEGLAHILQKGDTIIDGGNSFYKDSRGRANKLSKLGIHFLDAGVSGGPEGARYGPALMIGGSRKVFVRIEPLFKALARTNGYEFFDGEGAGHFVKMIHNGIEYGMMQSIAEGFSILKKSRYHLDLTKAAGVYNQGSVIQSRLISWLKDALILHGNDLKNISGSAAQTGEGAWTIRAAQELKIKAKVIEEAVKFRTQSQKNPSYAGKVVSALREQFGGHEVRIHPVRSRSRSG